MIFVHIGKGRAFNLCHTQITSKDVFYLSASLFLKMITYVVPATYYIDILNGLYLRNLTFSYLWPSFLVLFLMFLFLSTVNMVILKKEGL